MSLVIADTSAWIEYLRSGKGRVTDQLDDLLNDDAIVLCGIVEMELLWGVRSHERNRLSKLLETLVYIETTRGDYVAAGRLLGALREKGITIPSTDGLIAALCLKHRLKLLTTDSHFLKIKGLVLV